MLRCTRVISKAESGIEYPALDVRDQTNNDSTPDTGRVATRVSDRREVELPTRLRLWDVETVCIITTMQPLSSRGLERAKRPEPQMRMGFDVPS